MVLGSPQDFTGRLQIQDSALPRPRVGDRESGTPNFGPFTTKGQLKP